MNSILNILLFITAILIIILILIGANIYLDKIKFVDQIPYTNNTINIKNNKINIKEDSSNNWLSILTKKEIKSFSYPSLEMSATFNLSNAIKTNILSIINLDAYKLFCLQEILKNNNIQYSYTQTNNNANIELILTKNIKQKFLTELESYNIQYQIK